MKHICGLILLAVLALGQTCDVQNLLPAGGQGNTTNQTSGDGNGTTSRGTPTGINAAPSGSSRPEMGAEIAIQIVSQSRQDADVLVRYLVGSTEVRRTALHVPAGATMPPIGPDLAVVVAITGTHANGAALPQTILQLGQQFEAGELRECVILDPNGLCTADPSKYDPGQCGCGVADTDTDGDGTADCNDGCPSDPAKTAPGACGCGQPDTDQDGDGLPDCTDPCPGNSGSNSPGSCGCGRNDVDTDGDSVPDCHDNCPNDPLKTSPGVCGCGVPDTDTDGDGYPDCIDECASDPLKTDPGVCGCDVPEGSCSTTQACCFGSVDCSDMPAEQCKASYGSPLGPGTSCEVDRYKCYMPPSWGLYWSTATGDINVTLLTITRPTSQIVRIGYPVQSLHLSQADGRLYWISNGLFQSCLKDGSDLQTLPVSPAGTPVALTTDWMTYSLLWTEFSTPDGLMIFRYPLGSPATPNLDYSTGGATGVGPIGVLNYGQSRLFFAYPTSNGNVLGCTPALDNGSSNYACITPSAVITDILESTALSQLYWVEVDFSGSTGPTSWIRSADGTGATPTMLFSRQEAIESIAYDASTGMLYWTVPSRGEIMRSNLDGSGAELYLGGLSDVKDVAIGPVSGGY